MHGSHGRGRAVPGIRGWVALGLVIACGPTGPADSAGAGTGTGAGTSAGATTGSSGVDDESDTGTEPTTDGPTEMEEAACAERCAARVPSGFPEPQQPGSAPRSTDLIDGVKYIYCIWRSCGSDSGLLDQIVDLRRWERRVARYRGLRGQSFCAHSRSRALSFSSALASTTFHSSSGSASAHARILRFTLASTLRPISSHSCRSRRTLRL